MKKTVLQIAIKITALLLMQVGITVSAQNIDLVNTKEMFKKKNIVKVSGGVSANSVFSGGTGTYGRNLFAYFINGNVNVNLFRQLNLPFSFNLTNAGNGYAYPTLPNRLSLHPTYKWVSGHIGDVSMNFSPYTLSGHQFTGAGFDLTPEGKIKLSAMYGRLQRPVEYDSANRNIPAAYRRMGYGTKLSYEKQNYRIGMIVFGAKDAVNSLQIKPDSLLINPQQNLVISWDVVAKPMKGLELSAEYATSALTRDIRDTTEMRSKSGNVLSGLVNAKNSTSYYKAIKTQLNYAFHKSTLGVGYERIDPGYQTLGAYFFTNDIENITVNFAQPFLRDKANVAANIGYQRDDLDGTKSGSNKRTVGSVNLNYNPNQRMSASVSYSNFQTFMFIKPQFQFINQLPDFQNLDTLNFSQVSQNANVNINYMFGKRKTINQSLNFNVSFQDAADKQGGVVRLGNASQFYNTTAAYSLLFIPQSISITTAFNASYNTIGKNNFITLGPTLAVNTKLFNKKLVTGFSTSFNSSSASGVKQNSILNMRCNATYIYKKKHTVGISIMNQSRSVINQAKSNNITGTVGYNYNF
jgi:hypothetical protein